MGSSESLLKIIEDRAKKSIPDTLVYRTPMVITTVVSNFQAKAKIVGHDAEYTLLNKTGHLLTSGDSVIVESTGTSLNNGLIVYKFGQSSINFEASLQAAALLTAIKTVDGAGSGLDADLLDGLSSSAYDTTAPVRTRFSKIEEDFINAPTLARGMNLALNFTSVGTGTFIDWNLRDDNHPGMAIIKSTATNPSGGLLTSATYSAGVATFGGSTYINGVEELDVIFNVQSVAATKTCHIGRHDGTGAAVPTLGYYILISNTTLTGYVDTTSYPTGTTYSISASTWYRIKMAVNSAKNIVTFTLYNASGTVLWTDTVSRTLSTSQLPIFSCRNISTSGVSSDLTLFDYISYDIPKTLTR